MTAHDVALWFVYQVPFIAFAMIAVATLVLPLVHLTFVIGRVLSGQPANVNWWVVGRVLPFILAVAVVGPLIALAQGWTRPEQIAVGEVVLIYLSAGMVFLPIALPLLQAYVQNHPRFGSLVYALLAVLALPVAAAIATQSAIATTGAIATPQPDQIAAFMLDTTISQCKVDFFQVLPEGYVSELPRADAPIEQTYAPYFFFWVDMTFKAALLDFFETFDCGVTNLRHNPNHVMMSSLVFLYRAFVSLIALAVITLPFRVGRNL